MKDHKPIDDKKNNVQSFRCKKCDENLKCKIDLKKHVQDKHPKVYRCKKCDLSFVKCSDLEKHVKAFILTLNNISVVIVVKYSFYNGV